jgi:hypothetical protein
MLPSATKRVGDYFDLIAGTKVEDQLPGYAIGLRIDLERFIGS